MNSLFKSLLPIATVFASYYYTINNPEQISKQLHRMRILALTEIQKPWGCPSLTSKDACDNYDPNRYK